MKIKVDLNGHKRKELASTIGEILDKTVTYKGAPSFDYLVGNTIISRDGAITTEDGGKKDRKGAAAINRLLEGLRKHGFDAHVIGDEDQVPIKFFSKTEMSQVPEAPQVLKEESSFSSNGKPALEIQAVSESDISNISDTAKTTDKLTVQIPIEGFDGNSLQNLRLLVESKASLIKKSLGITDLTIEKTETTIDFPWFGANLPSQELKAYTNLITAMCDMAKRQKRVMAVEKPCENDKFTFRLFLVRLGLIGDNYADTRRILLRDLKGNGSWKDAEGKKTPTRQGERSRQDQQSPGITDAYGTVDMFPSFTDEDDTKVIRSKISFVKRLGYFLQHFDD